MLHRALGREAGVRQQETEALWHHIGTSRWIHWMTLMNPLDVFGFWIHLDPFGL